MSADPAPREPAARAQGAAARSRDERLKRLTELSRGFTYAASLSEILRHAAEQAADLLDADKAILMLADEEGLLRVRASFGVSDDVVTRFRASFDESLASRLKGLFGGDHGFLGVPLVTQGKVMGLLAVMRQDAREMSPDDEWLLSALADQMAAPIENAHLAAEMEHAALLVENARLYESERQARRASDKARAEADAANQAKTDFLANMSHELRTPLNAIAGYVDLLQMGLRGPLTDAQLADLERIGQNQRMLLSLINDVLNFAKLEAGRVELTLTDVRLHEVLGGLKALILPQLMARALSYRYMPVDPDLTAYADREKIQQIVLNLLSNAVKYTADGGEITLTAEPAGDDVRILVRDTGRGIAADKLDQVFKPFVRVDAGYTRSTEGTGLGLSIGRDLARTMGGDIWAESTLGVGSTFIVRLPRRRRGS